MCGMQAVAVGLTWWLLLGSRTQAFGGWSAVGFPCPLPQRTADSGKATLPCLERSGVGGVETGRDTTLLALVLMEREKNQCLDLISSEAF